MRRLWRSLEIRGRLRCVVGFGGPADTAIGAGALYALRGMLPLPVEITPSFEAERPSLGGWLRARPWLAPLAVIGLGLVLSTETRNLIRGR